MILKRSTILSLIFVMMVHIACSQHKASAPNTGNENGSSLKYKNMNIKIGDTILTATLTDNSSTRALTQALAEAPITIEMSDYGNFEKVGSLGRSFPRNDVQTTTQAGDLILYQGDKFVIYYDTNSWSFTRLGKIDNISQHQLKEILGKGNVTVTLSLAN